MRFISYAQRHEDVILNCSLRGVKEGFHIDSRCVRPTENSVTQTFYERGWRGIKIEPNSHFFGRFAKGRPDDINYFYLQVAAGDRLVA